MDVTIQARNIEVSDGVRSYVTRKIERAQRRLNMPMAAHVVIARAGSRAADHRMVVEATVSCDGKVLRGEERGPTIQAAADALADTLDRRVAHFKARFYRSKAGKREGQSMNIRELEAAAQDAQAEGDEDGDEEEMAFGRVVRTKRFAMKPTSVEEAATQMELLGHAFFFFVNDTTEAPSVLYRRRDGDYGLIEPLRGL